MGYETNAGLKCGWKGRLAPSTGARPIRIARRPRGLPDSSGPPVSYLLCKSPGVSGEFTPASDPGGLDR